MNRDDAAQARRLAALLWIARATAFVAIPALAHDAPHDASHDAKAPVRAAATVSTRLQVAVPGHDALVLDAAALTGMPRATLTAPDHDGKPARWSGVALRDVLARAGAAAGDSLRGAALHEVVVVTGSDGYRVAFSLAELSSVRADGAPAVLLADRRDDAGLGADGAWRLVVPGDVRFGRWVRNVSKVDVVDAIH